MYKRQVEGTEQLLKECKENGFKALLYINFFFDWTGGLKSDWEEVYANYRVVFDKYKDDIFSFYVDEPKWNKIDETSFRTATKKLREDYPEKRMLAILAYPTLEEDCASYFEYCTDLGLSLIHI